MPTPKPVLLDGSFLDALSDDASPRHESAVEHYAALVERFRTRSIRLIATNEELRDRPDRSRLAAVDTHHIAKQERIAAADVRIDDPDGEFRTLLVVLQRLKVVEVASFDQRLAAFGFEVLNDAALDDAAIGDEAGVPPGYVPYDQ